MILPQNSTSLRGFPTSAEVARARQHRPAEVAESQQRATDLRHLHEQTTAYLRHLLPFAWQVAKVRPRYQGPPVFERGPAALHLQLLEPVTLAAGTKQTQARAAGDWLCRAALDTSTGARRYESEPAPWYSAGSGVSYQPTPTCRHCLTRVQLLLAHPCQPTRA
jgi:hypothetical protein